MASPGRKPVFGAANSEIGQVTGIGHDAIFESPQAGAEEQAFKALSVAEAKEILAASPSVSMWRILAAQSCIGLAVAVVAWISTGRNAVGLSAAYGCMAVVVPGAVFARGLSRQKQAMPGNAALAGFFLWEMVKIALTVALLVAAPRLVVGLSWLAMLAGFLITMKVYWLAVWLRPRYKTPAQDFES